MIDTDPLLAEIKRRVRTAHALLAEVERLREGIKAYLDLEIETHELKEMIE